MKKGIIILTSLTLVALLSVPTTIDVMVFALPNVYQNTFYAGMKQKIELDADESNKKIVVIGGSSVPFSLDCTYVKQYLPEYSPVDFGLYASLGTNLMLDLADDHIKKGDIYIISPEFSSETLSMHYNGLETYKALEQNKNLLWSLDSKMKQTLLGDAPKFVADKLSYIKDGVVPTPKDIYHVNSFNEYGDIGVNRKGNILSGGVDSNHPISLNKDMVTDDFFARMNQFGKDCADKGASCYFRFSPMNASAVTNKGNLTAFYDHIKSHIEFEMLGDPFNAMLEKEWFYDTNYHLNTPGAIKWTKQFIKDIKLTLDDPSPTDIPDPDKPELIDPEKKEGDNTFASYFVYQDGDKESKITGLVKQEEAMIVPYRHNEKVITSFAAMTFASSKGIKEITLQDNIRLIEDGSFFGSEIERIVIDNDLPNSISVGSALLEGSSADIYVSEENLSAYKSSYNWAQYSSRIKSK